MPGLSDVGHLTQGVACLQLDMAAFQIGTEGWVVATGRDRDPTTAGRNELRPYES
jgi:hypothetical protein